jgi:signal transduction histidine kinase
MTASRLPRQFLPLLAVVALVGALVFLYLRTQAVDFAAGAQSMRLLRELKEADTRWDSEARALVEAEGGAAFAGSFGRIERTLRDLQHARLLPGMEGDVAALVASAQEKQVTFAMLQGANALHARERSPASQRAELAAWEKFHFHTFGGRIELTIRNLGQRLEAGLDDTHRWRIYLGAYAAALLLGVAYLALRVAHAQAALQAANDQLERRVTDRTLELTQTLDRLRESEAQLVQTEKMSSLGQLVAGVAHEINTPLAYVKNSVTNMRDRMPELRDTVEQSERLLALLQQESPDAQDLQDAFSRLAARLQQLREHEVLADLDTLTRDGLHGIEQMSELVDNLRNFSRLDRSRVASYNVNDSVRAAFLIARPMLRKIDVEQQLGEIPSITCSPSQVNQVVLNLVTNAAQAIDKPRGRIVATTRREGAAHVAIEVVDDGKGIPADVLPRIFDPFFTTKDVGKGTGLGLSIAFKIVAQHGGRIDVRSTVGSGTTFTVVLPIAPPEVPASSERQEALA